MASKIIFIVGLFVAASNAGFVADPVASYAAAASPLVPAAAVVKYSPATAVSHSYSSIAAPAPLAYAAPAYAASAYAAPAYAAPAYAASAYAAPIAKSVSYAPATIAVSSPAVGSTQQNIYRSFGGTVSQYSKAVDTAFSSVRKYDTRVSNNVYAPAVAKTLAYSAPAIVATHAAPSLAAHVAAPAVLAAPATAYAAKAISYSPAATVAHVAFDGLGVHYGW